MYFIYEVRMAGRDIKIDRETWSKIREYAREHKLFYVVYLDQKYKYTHAQTFMDRPTRFDFEPLSPDEEGVIEYIYIKELED